MQAFLTEDKMCCHKTAGVFVPQTRCIAATDASTILSLLAIGKRKNCYLLAVTIKCSTLCTYHSASTTPVTLSKGAFKGEEEKKEVK